MSKKIFLNVRRGMTTAAPIAVFPWEKRILEHVHGQECEIVSIDEMCSIEGAVKVEKIKMRHGEPAPSQREQLVRMCAVDPEDDPLLDPSAEYARLEGCYGMDHDLPITNIERVYGAFNSGQFTTVVRDAQEPEELDVLEAGGALDTEEDLESLSVAQLRDIAAARDVKIVAGWSKAQVIEAISKQGVAA